MSQSKSRTRMIGVFCLSASVALSIAYLNSRDLFTATSFANSQKLSSPLQPNFNSANNADEFSLHSMDDTREALTSNAILPPTDLQSKPHDQPFLEKEIESSISEQVKNRIWHHKATAAIPSINELSTTLSLAIESQDPTLIAQTLPLLDGFVDKPHIPQLLSLLNHADPEIRKNSLLLIKEDLMSDSVYEELLYVSEQDQNDEIRALSKKMVDEIDLHNR